MPRPPLRATDYTLELVADLLAKQGILTDDARRTAFARENVQRARLLRDSASRAGGRGLRRAEISPVEILASFQFVDARREGEVVDEDKATQAVAQALEVPYRKIDPLKLDAQLITRTLSRPFARKHGVLPLERKNGTLFFAATNPFDRELFENLRGLTGGDVQPVLASPTDIHRAIAEIYGFRQQISQARVQLEDNVAPDVGNLEQFVNLTGIEALEASSEPVIAAVEYLLHYAFEQRASDIHIEPRREESVIRMRIDGVLHPIHRIPRAVHGAIANRFKIMSRLDIALKRPQDGRIRTARGDAEMELRVSTVPTTFGDKVVVRVLDPNVLVRDLSELGFLPDERETFERWLLRPHGLVVVTGPTGSGKTTTLYSALQALTSPEVNVVTIEDPIEMVHEDFNQIAANPKTGTSFADALRARPAPGPGRHHGGRGARPRDRHPGGSGGAHRPPGPHHAAHQRHGERGGAPPRSGRPELPHRRHADRRGRPAPGAAGLSGLRAGRDRSPPTRWRCWAFPIPRSWPGGCWRAAARAATSAASPATTAGAGSSRCWGSTRGCAT